MKNYKTAVHAARFKVGLKELDRAATSLEKGLAKRFFLTGFINQHDKGEGIPALAKVMVSEHYCNLGQLHDVMIKSLMGGNP